MKRTEKMLKSSNLKFKTNLNEKTNQNPSVAMSRKERGITLIALVVTIVVLIILATISINAVLGENGIIRRAEIAGEHQANAEVADREALGVLDGHIANAMAGNGGSTQTPTDPENPNPSNPEGGDEPTGNIDPETGWDLEKVNKVTSEDNVVVPVPKGYTASTVDGEKSVASGFVIKEGTNGGATSGVNEFVWVPVAEISDLYDATNNAGQLWNFSGTTSSKKTYPTTLNSGTREPDVVTSASSGSNSASGSKYDNGPSNITNITSLDEAGFSTTDANNNLDNSEDGLVTASDFKIQLQNEFNSMVESVEKYGGFYIGRYETGNLSKAEAVVQKGNTNIGSRPWYTQYKLNKTIRVNENVVSSMIWGCQWDATLRWLQTSEVEKVKNFATNSASYGNYKDNSISYVENGETKTTTSGTYSVIPTGSAEITNINNIYDMAGNVYEWTLEANGTKYRTRRGGDSYSSGSYNPACDRYDDYPTNSITYGGSRATLYVAL